MSKTWPKIRLGEVIREEREQAGSFDGDGLPVLGVTNVEGVMHTGVEASDDKSKYLRLRPGRFVYNPYRINVGSIGLSSETQNGICSPAYVVFTPSSQVDARFLRFFLKSARGNQLINFHGNRGTVRSALRFDDLCQIEIPLPLLAEQRRIVARIEKLATGIQQAKKLREDSGVERQILYARLMDSTFESPSSEMVHIGSKFRVSTGGTPSRANPAYWNGNTNWVSSGEVAFCRIRDTAEKITDLGVRESNAKVYPPSTVLLAMIGQGKTRGQCAILECHAATNQNVAGIHVYETEHIPEYVYWWLFANYQRSRSTETGTAQPALSGERVKQMVLPLPHPSEQRRIVAELDVLQAEVDALKRLQSETAAELDALMPAILDRAFKGEL